LVDLTVLLCLIIFLGRHISQIRSLTGGIWHSNQLKLINYLYKNGSNNIWEHSLIDSHSGRAKKKPVSKYIYF
jgi:hypothetical protein